MNFQKLQRVSLTISNFFDKYEHQGIVPFVLHIIGIIRFKKKIILFLSLSFTNFAQNIGNATIL